MSPVEAPPQLEIEVNEDRRGNEFDRNVLRKTASAVLALEQKNKSKYTKEEEPEGFTRSISLYLHWVRGQKAASKVGKVRWGQGVCVFAQGEAPEHMQGIWLPDTPSP